MTLPLFLRSLDENASIPVIVVSQTPFVVGRRGDSDASLQVQQVSGRHACFSFSNNAWTLEDLQSTNGTFVNGKRIESRVWLRPGDKVQFATLRYEVVDRLAGPITISAPTKVLSQEEDIETTRDLARVITDKRTFSLFQPIRKLKTLETVGWESLGRGVTDNGTLSAGPLYWMAGRNQLEIELSMAFFKTTFACLECGHCWRQKNRLLFLNVSPAEINDPALFTRLDALARHPALAWAKFVIEIPDAVVMDKTVVSAFVRKLRERGLMVAFDGFGIGKARISDVIAVPPDFLKMQRDLLLNVEQETARMALLRAIVDACQEINTATVIVGLESHQEVQICKSLGVDLGQGFLFSEPKSPYELFEVDASTLPGTCPFVQLGLS